jgi:hypothetical protein
MARRVPADAVGVVAGAVTGMVPAVVSGRVGTGLCSSVAMVVVVRIGFVGRAATPSIDTEPPVTVVSPRCTRSVSLFTDVGFSTRTEYEIIAVFMEVPNATTACPDSSVVTSA